MNTFLAFVLTAAALFSSGKGTGPTLPAGTILHTRLDDTLTTADLRVGERFTFRVVAPYPRHARRLAGARISAYATGITRPRNSRRARIDLVFARIIFAGGGSKPIAAYVDDPAFTRREPGDFTPRDMQVASAAGPSRLPTLGGHLQNDTLAQVNFGPKAPKSTGAYAYAGRDGVELVLPANQAYKLELAAGLTLP